MLVTLDSELQAQRRKNLEDLAKLYGGGQQVEIEQTGEIVTPRSAHPRPIASRRRLI